MKMIVKTPPPLIVTNIKLAANLSFNFMLRKSKMPNATLTAIITENQANKTAITSLSKNLTAE